MAPTDENSAQHAVLNSAASLFKKTEDKVDEEEESKEQLGEWEENFQREFKEFHTLKEGELGRGRRERKHTPALGYVDLPFSESSEWDLDSDSAGSGSEY